MYGGVFPVGSLLFVSEEKWGWCDHPTGNQTSIWNTKHAIHPIAYQPSNAIHMAVFNIIAAYGYTSVVVASVLMTLYFTEHCVKYLNEICAYFFV